ncbi:OLC1v1031982C1 [Oldenlandia corymbosa var. corymbosa]|uniref:OLC1v1031982C1 n=1 Tax=Oldenlandia corymbosa var. corymbosa TaxID=529605 RepID=A0AAV1CMM5_OLDCO|nr:OLC1v1031982C1 [Oldenlandia corymbosa var. corymbosa]
MASNQKSVDSLADAPEQQKRLEKLNQKPTRKKLDPTSTCVDAALETLLNCDQQKQWTPIKMGFDFFKTFLTFIPHWSSSGFPDKGSGVHFGDLLSRMEDAFEKAGWEIETAINRGQTEDLDALRSSLLKKIELFKPEVRDAYVFLADYAFRTTAAVPGNFVWTRLYGSLLSNCQNLYSVGSLSFPLLKKFEQISNISHLAEVVFRYPDQFSDLCTQHRGVGICIARLLFFRWVEGTNWAEEKMAVDVELSDLVQRIKPITPSILGMYLKAIESQPCSLQKALVEELVEITLILVPEDQSLEKLRDCLVFLVSDLVESSNELITEVICKAASLGYSSSSTARAKGSDDNALALPQLLREAELLTIGILLTELGESDSISKTRFETICAGERFHDAYLEKMMLILQQIETLISEGSLNDVPAAAKVSIGFYLSVFQAFLVELMRDSPGLVVLLKDHIQRLSEGSKLFYKYSSILPLKNPNDMVSISTAMNKAIEEAETLHDFCLSHQIVEQNIKHMSMLLSNFLKAFKLLNDKLKGTYLHFRNSLKLSFPTTLPGLGFVDSLVDRLSELVKYRKTNNCQIEVLLTQLNSLKPYLKRVGGKHNENLELMKDLQRGVICAAYEADHVIDSINLPDADGCHLLWLSDVIDDVKLVKEELIKYNNMNKGLAEVQKAVQTSENRTIQSDAPEVGEVIVSLDDEETRIIDRLKNGSSEREVVGIVGMPGIGKTTLAKKVYDNDIVKKHFERFAWCCISQEYRRREVMLKMLSDIANTIKQVRNESDQKLVEKLQKSHEETDPQLLNLLRQSLLGKRYLIVMDDVWGKEAWEDLMNGFPKESRGSRILFTSRSNKGLFNQQDCFLHCPRFLKDEESWKLLQKKVFREGKCPLDLMQVGRVIAERCRGLPLAIVAVAGLLSRTERQADRWNQIKEHLKSHILDPQTQCDQILQLSYNHLPDDLKPCFLYFAAFREDNEVPVKKLVRLWIAEGLIRKVDDKELEDVAGDYVEDLIGRSLIMAARKGPDNKAKACRVHDMLHSLCLTKSKEQNFLKCISRSYDELYPSYKEDYGSELKPNSKVTPYLIHRLSICSKRYQFVNLEPSGPPVRTLLVFPTSDTYPRCAYDVSFIPRNFKLLRVLDIESINLGTSFPEGILSLDPLRYLALSGEIKAVPSTIEKLWNLETFIIKVFTVNTQLPNTIWSMPKLRHLHVNIGAVFTNLQEGGSQASSTRLDNLLTLSSPVVSDFKEMEEIMKKVPQLKKLRCTFSPAQYSSEDCNIKVLVPDLLEGLESLKILYKGTSRRPYELSFPSNLRKLSLSDFSLTWSCVSSIGKLSQLEVLTLVSISFESQKWEMSEDDEFEELKVLKLDSLQLVQWEASQNNFPSLERLVLRSCKNLQEVPPDFGKITTLQMIELMWCSSAAENSLGKIKYQQVEVVQNEGFKTIVNDPAAAFRTYV